MNPVLQPEIRELIETAHYRPAVSILMPFRPYMTSKTLLTQQLKVSADRVERLLLKDYPGEVVILIMQKLQAVMKNINFNTPAKSIAIYVSPVFEKVLYPDIELEEKVIIDDSFQIRDLLYHKKQQRNYLVLILGGRHSKIYHGVMDNLSIMVSAPFRPVYDYIREASQRISDFSDISEHRQIVTEKYLKHADQTLGIILNAYKLPVFVMAPQKILGHFKKLTKHNKSVIEYITGNYEEASAGELKEIVRPWLRDWDTILQKDVLHKIEFAADQKRLATGLEEVWRETAGGKGKLLIVEKSFIREAQKLDANRIHAIPPNSYSKFSYIHDAVDDMIEKVLQNGGDIEFVEDGLLHKYDHVALIKYY